jgi:SHS2 domain-containing protein
MAEEPIEIVEHTADWALRVRGEDLGMLFEHAAMGMAILLVEDPRALPADIERDIELEAYDAESLLVGWLEELAFWAESEGLVFHDFEIREIDNGCLTATVRGGKAPVLDKHIKAVTFHNLAITAIDSGLEVTIVFDV